MEFQLPGEQQVRTNKNTVERVLANLVKNAIEAIQERRQVRHPPQDVDDQDDALLLAVIDDLVRPGVVEQHPASATGRVVVAGEQHPLWFSTLA